jgi:hypothetical protein
LQTDTRRQGPIVEHQRLTRQPETFMKRFLTCALAVLAAALAAACHNSGTDQNSTQVRVVNAVVDADPLDFLIDDNVESSSISVGTISSFDEFGSGTHDLKLRSTQSGAALLDKSLNFASGTHYTVVAYGKRSSISTLILTDDVAGPSSGHFKVRFVGLSADVGPVDVYFTGGDISSIPAAQSGVVFGGTTDYVEVTPGSFNVVFTVAGTKDIVFQSSAAQSFTDGTIYTIGVFPSLGGKLANALLLVNNGSGSLLANPLGRLKAVNAIPDSTPLNFKADGTTLLSSVPFMGASTYVTTAAGQRTLQLESASVPGAIIASATLQLAPARDFTMLALGSMAQPQLAVLTDDNTVPPAGLAKIRFVNAMTGSGNVDVLLDFASRAAGLAPGTASAYSAVAPKTDYVISFTTPGGVTQLATLSPVELDAGAVYSAYVFASGSNVQARLVRDR